MDKIKSKNKQFLLLLDGMMGAGKTTTSKLLAEKLPRTAVIGMDKIKKFVSDFERGTRDNAIARAVIVEMTRKYLELGLSVIIEQPINPDVELKEFEKMTQDRSIPLIKYQLFTTPDIAFERVIERQKNSTSTNKNPKERIRRNISLYAPKSDLGFEVIDTTDKKSDEASKIILSKIESLA